MNEEEHGEGLNQDEFSDLREELSTYIQEAEKSLSTKTLLLQRNSNAPSQRPNVSELGKRDPSIKKNSAFIKKLRIMGAPQMDLLIKECQSLNLSKYLSEVAVAIVEARIKFTDIPSSILLCTELNCTYAEFSSFLQEEYIKVLAINKDEPIANTNRLRVEICFYAELSLCGVIPARQSLPVLGTALTVLTSDRTFNTLSLVLSFCKHCGADFAGLVPRQIRMLSEQFGEVVPKSDLLVSSRQESVRKLLHDYYKALCQHLIGEMNKLNAYENQNKQMLMAKGELRPDRITNVEVMRAEINNLLSGAVTLSELLDKELPDLPDTELLDVTLGDGDEGGGGHVWEDDEVRLFYTQLPDVQEYLGQINVQDDKTDCIMKKVNEMGKTDDAECQSKKTALETFLKLLPECHSREMIDNAALEFLIYFNSKAGRKKLIITLFTLPRTKMQMLAFYARFVAILNPVVPEIAATLGQQLKSDMIRQIHKKDQVNVGSKKKNLKFIGELVNFNVYPKKEALRALKLLLYDFTHHNVEMACCLLETCGNVLYAASDAHLSTKYYLEQMMRLKTMMTVDSRYVTMIENTYYHILPPEPTAKPAEMQMTLMQMFIYKLLYQDLVRPGSDTEVLNTLRKLDWDDREVASFAISCLINASKICYYRIRGLAHVVSMLTEYQEDVVCRVLDGVLEDVRLGMEVNEVSFNQRRVAMVKYLGELYNYMLFDTSDILKMLYSLISFGVTQDLDVTSPVDPPTSVMRIHLVLILLKTCTFSLDVPETAKKLDYFLVYFQRYYWLKRSGNMWNEEQPFPKDIVHRFEDILDFLSPDFKLASDLVTANNAVNNLNNKMYSKAATDNPNLMSLLCSVFEDRESSGADSDEDESNNPLPSQECSQTKKLDEDDYFLQELNKIVSESVKETEVTAKPNTDIAVPFNYKKGFEDNKPQFVLLMKKGNKQTCKTLSLPSDHELFVHLKTREEASQREKEKVKRLTLDINERLQDDS